MGNPQLLFSFQSKLWRKSDVTNLINLDRALLYLPSCAYALPPDATISTPLIFATAPFLLQFAGAIVILARRLRLLHRHSGDDLQLQPLAVSSLALVTKSPRASDLAWPPLAPHEPSFERAFAEARMFVNVAYAGGEPSIPALKEIDHV